MHLYSVAVVYYNTISGTLTQYNLTIKRKAKSASAAISQISAILSGVSKCEDSLGNILSDIVSITATKLS